MKASIAMVRHADIDLSSAVGNHGQTTDPAILPVIGGDRLRLYNQNRARRGQAEMAQRPRSASLQRTAPGQNHEIGTQEPSSLDNRRRR